MNRLLKRFLLVASLSVVSMTSLTGCFLKPYNKPEFQTIQANQTAFLIPIVGDTTKQDVFESEKLLSETKVATKEVQIPKRWVQTGRLSFEGEWRPSARVIVVDRSPVTREWTSDKNSGTSELNQGVTAKTKDGIKLTLNVNATAQIDEALATKFLYFYNTNQLSQIMDTEIKTMVHSRLIEEVSKYTLAEIDVEQIIKSVREEVTTYFLDRGITITALGFSSDPIYPEDIQKSMNDKIKAINAQEAQAIANKTAEDKAKSESLQAKMQQETLQSQMKLKELEIKEKLVEKWDGKLSLITGSNGGQIIDIGDIVK